MCINHRSKLPPLVLPLRAFDATTHNDPRTRRVKYMMMRLKKMVNRNHFDRTVFVALNGMLFVELFRIISSIFE